MIYQESRMLPDLTWFDPDWSSPLSKRTPFNLIPQSDSTKLLRISCGHPLLTQFNMSNEGRLRGYCTSTLNNYTTMQQAPCLLHHPERLASAPFRAHTDTAIIGETYVYINIYNISIYSFMCVRCQKQCVAKGAKGFFIQQHSWLERNLTFIIFCNLLYHVAFICSWFCNFETWWNWLITI